MLNLPPFGFWLLDFIIQSSAGWLKSCLLSKISFLCRYLWAVIKSPLNLLLDKLLAWDTYGRFPRPQTVLIALSWTASNFLFFFFPPSPQCLFWNGGTRMRQCLWLGLTATVRKGCATFLLVLTCLYSMADAGSPDCLWPQECLGIWDSLGMYSLNVTYFPCSWNFSPVRGKPAPGWGRQVFLRPRFSSLPARGSWSKSSWVLWGLIAGVLAWMCDSDLGQPWACWSPFQTH